MALLEVKDLKTYFRTDDGIVKAVDGVSFSVEKGKTLGIVGESGCGKSVTCLTIMGLNNRKTTISSGEALWKGQNLIGMSPKELREDPRRRDRDDLPGPDDLAEPRAQDRVAARPRRSCSTRTSRRPPPAARALELLKAVGIPRADARIDDYPHQFSGGMRQRVMIAMALVNNPDLLIADEPTTALDVTTQAQILDLMKRLQDEFGSAIIMITHDLGVVAEVADDVVVMYAARVQEEGEVRNLFRRPEPPVHVGPARVAAAPPPGRRTARADLRPAAVAALPAAGVPLPSALSVRDADLQSDRARARGRARGGRSPPGALPPRPGHEGP